MSDARTIQQTTERSATGLNGPLMLLVLLGLGLVSAFCFYQGGGFSVLGALTSILALIVLMGFYAIAPNQAIVITLFGQYKGTDRHTGLRWVLFWYGRKKMSLRVRNVTSETLKVNDKRGNPIEIAANIVWRVADTAQATFDVENFETFVNIQIETALRETASHYAYDHAEDEEPTLRADAEIVGAKLREDLRQRVAVAGVAIDEAHLMHLAYAPEIAGSMLKRQQAEAVIAARGKIVIGAVSMVENALQMLAERGVVELDEERKAAMVSNLLVVLCADREAQPVLNTGSLYN